MKILKLERRLKGRIQGYEKKCNSLFLKRIQGKEIEEAHPLKQGLKHDLKRAKTKDFPLKKHIH